VRVRFVHPSLTFGDSSNPCNDLTLTMLAAVAQFERALILERQREGITLAKAEGRYKRGKPSLSHADAEAAARRLTEGESAAALAREFMIPGIRAPLERTARGIERCRRVRRPGRSGASHLEGDAPGRTN
jgi:DNA invertase Pin-like site-specific DNA recombinase